MSIFGESISNIMSRSGEDKIPSFVKQTLGFLNSQENLEGIFRNSAGVREIDQLKAQFNTGDTVNLNGIDKHLVAGLLKEYFIALPEPLLTFELYDNFIEVADTPDCKSKVKDIIQQLPEVNKLTAACLFYFLSRIAKQETQSKMTTHNLAIVFGQILLRPKVESLVSLLRHSPKITSLLKCIIENYDDIIPANNQEAQLIECLITPGKENPSSSPSSVETTLSPNQRKLQNLKLTADDSIQAVLDRLDEMSKELATTTSLEETIEIAKRVRTAKRLLFSKEQ